MTQDEVFKAITTPLKWYEPVEKTKISAQYACIIKKRFKEGRLTKKWIEDFFCYFGYYIEEKESWEKAMW